MILQKSLWIILALFLGACSAKKNLLQERQRTSPPQNTQDVGVILEGAEQEQVTDILIAHPQALVRTLSAEHGLYEIFGVESEQLKREYDGASEPNQFFALGPEKNLDLKLQSITAPVGLKVGNLSPCKAGEASPEATLTSEAPRADLDGQTINLGQSVKLNGLKSKNPIPNSPALKMALVVMAPEDAPQSQVVQDGSAIEFKPDTLGLYKIYLVVQDAGDVCAIDGVRFLVSSNPAFLGAKAKASAPVDLAKFTHLAMVSAEKSWQISRGDGVIIAIVDTGVNYNHPALAPNIYVNENEIPSNGIDDDKNGYIDDYIGYDFVNQDPYPYDDDSHGTHVAGLAASSQFGLAPNAKILVIKALSSNGGDAGTISAAILYAVDRGAKIVNLSLGGATPQPHPALVSAAAYAEKKGVLIVAAAGNGDPETGLGFNIDDQPVYPASLKNSNLVAVAAFYDGDALSAYSNFGPKSVHVVAPGGSDMASMYSTAFENPRGELYLGKSGTSMAAPVVAGIAAQVWSRTPRLSVQEVKSILMTSGPLVPELKAMTVSGRHIDAFSAVDLANNQNVLF